MKALADQYGLPLWMSEFAVAGDFMEWAVIMHRLISEYNVSAVDYLWGFLEAMTPNSWCASITPDLVTWATCR